ncbi:TadE/TadG family type IV pilus assembly protein [Bradyrhizobium tropiciagri]|uniref:TadE/TadG family type IV pilus assembly protein n=1 Tax=Bradyrhizobium tropiciagri TaxID=312253 RepID=UPI000AF820C6|nr:pilus assembly protein TadG-related protein [Bradyrhizobium tropiciagri]
MRNMLNCRRGSVAFATTIALVPLIGVMALGGEAGTWYVTQQRAQGTADAAAYSGALRLACDASPTAGTSCNNTQAYDYRGKQVAAQNAFCNASGDPTYPGSTCVSRSGITQTVQVASLASWNGTAGTYVQATISQQQPAYLARVLGMTTINVAATAIAQVDTGLAQPPCVLAVTGSVTFQGSATVSSPTCGISSNSNASNAIGFIGNSGISVNAPSYTVGGCSQTGGSQCTGVKTYQQPIPDPLSAVNTAISALKTADFPNKQCKTQPTSYETVKTGSCYNGSVTLSGNVTLSGTYYFNGDVTISGASTTVTGTATLIIFGNGTLTINGGPTIQLTAMAAPSGPSTLSSVLSKMAKLLIYDGENPKNNQDVSIGGSSTSYFNGIVYVPNAKLTYSGNSSSSAPAAGCYEVIAYAVKFQGNTKLDNSQCPNSTTSPGAGAEPNVQTVHLVQ